MLIHIILRVFFGFRQSCVFVYTQLHNSIIQDLLTSSEKSPTYSFEELRNQKDGLTMLGQTQSCETFNNEPLTIKEDFIIQGVEVWSFS